MADQFPTPADLEQLQKILGITAVSPVDATDLYTGTRLWREEIAQNLQTQLESSGRIEDLRQAILGQNPKVDLSFYPPAYFQEAV